MLGEKLRGQEDESMKLLEELELSHPEEVSEKRIHKSFKLKSKCWVRPGNLSQRDEFNLEGCTDQVSGNDLEAVFTRPLAVGDIYQVSFDSEVLNLSPLVVRCTRCRMVREDAFAVCLEFFRTVDLSENRGS